MNVIATGREAGVIAIGQGLEETEKRLAALLRGGSNIAIDNAEAPIGGDLLCQLLTQPIVRIRILGVSETPEFQTNVMVTITGNNLRIAVRHDATHFALRAGCEGRTARIAHLCLRSRVESQRGSSAAARSSAHRSTGTLHRWWPRGSDKVRELRKPGRSGSEGALTWLGEADPIKTVEKSRARDPRIDRLRAVMVQWREHIGNGKVRTNEAVRKAELNSDFREAVREATGGANGALNVGKLGTWLGSNEGRILDGASFKRSTLHGNTQWWLERHSS